MSTCDLIHITTIFIHSFPINITLLCIKSPSHNLRVMVYLRTASSFGSSALAVCWILPILFCKAQTRWFVEIISFSSSWNKEQACLDRSESCRRVRDRATLVMEHRSSNSNPSSLGMGCLHSSWGSTIRLAKGIFQ